MIFCVLFFRFFSLKLAALCVFICEIGWYGRIACSQTHLVGGGGGAVAVAAVFCQLFFCFFCSTIFKHICLFLSLSACISRVPFFWSVHIFLSTWIKRRQNKPKTQNQLDSSYIPFCRILCFAFNFRHNLFTVCTLDIGFIPLYTQCIFHIHFVYFFLFVWKVLCACFLLTTTDTKFMNTIEMYFVFFLSFLNWRGKKRSCWARYTITLKMSQMNHALTLTKLYCSNPFGCFAQSVFDGGSERKRSKSNYQNPWNMK